MNIREVAEGPQTQGANEKITYTVTTTNWVSSPASVAMYVDDSDGTDVTSTVCTGSTSVSGNVITLKAISGLSAGQRYRCEVQFTAGSGAPFECYFWIEAEE